VVIKNKRDGIAFALPNAYGARQRHARRVEQMYSEAIVFRIVADVVDGFIQA